VDLQPGDEVRLKHSGRKGKILQINQPAPKSAVLVDFASGTTIIVAQENLEPSGVRDPVRAAVNRRLSAYYAGERRYP
jgi:hypothetical protein